MAPSRYLVSVAQEPSTSPLKLRGKLLLADPTLRDGIFRKSVVVIHEHQVAQGAVGLVLNHPTGKVVGDFLKSPEFAPLSKIAVHHGGPVATHQLTFSAFWWTEDGGLRWAVHISPDQATRYARQPGHIVRAFLGYSGWSAGQLENELQQAAWFPLDPTPQLLGMAHDSQLWHDLLAAISPLHRLMANAPDDPFLN